MNITPTEIHSLEPDQVFVFASNLAGEYKSGSALKAIQAFGAKRGLVSGISGQSYAIPMRDKWAYPMPLRNVRLYVNLFLDHAQDHPEQKFLVTNLAEGIREYSTEDLGPMFSRVGANVWMPEAFWRGMGR